MKDQQGRVGFRPKLICIAVASCFVADAALANPTGHTVVHGTATFNHLGSVLKITNSPGAIINWQSFSIGAGEITRFIQQSQASSVLNRVTGSAGGIDPSIIMGALQSNGRVFLINPSGVVFGAGSRVDVAALVASSLNLSNADFHENRLQFTAVPDAGGIVNQGSIATASGGGVYLVGPAVTNKGIITSPQGEVVLAAGNRVELVNPGTPNLRVEIAATDNQAVNLGRIVADSGRVGIYAGLVNQSGTIRANGVERTGDGRIVLRAKQDTVVGDGSVTQANGTEGGMITIQSGGTTLVSGVVEATGSEGGGGTVKVLGNLVGLTGEASLDASGKSGGGTVLVGGDYQGNNATVQNAFRTYLGPDAVIRADAATSGDGGKVIVWSDDATRAYGTISARGGSAAGNGGFVEVSGKGWLDFGAEVDTRAPHGQTGTLLLDPTSLWIALNLANAASAGMPGTDTTASTGSGGLFEATGAVSYSLLTTGALTSALATNDVRVSTANSNPSAYGGEIVVVDPVTWSSNNSLSLLAHNGIYVQSQIRNTGTGDVSLFAGWNGSLQAPAVNTGGFGAIHLDAPINMGMPGARGNVILASHDGIFQQAGAPVTANRLLADGGEGGVYMGSAANMVNILAGRAGMDFFGSCCGYGSFDFNNGQSLAIGSVTAPAGTVNGIATNVGGIQVHSSGSLVIDQSVVSQNRYADAGIRLTGGTGVVINSAVSANQTSSSSFGSYGGGILIASGGALTINPGGSLLAQVQGAYGGDAGILLDAAGGVVVGGTVAANAGSSLIGAGGDAGIEIIAAGGPISVNAPVSATAGVGSTGAHGVAGINIASASSNVVLNGNVTTIGNGTTSQVFLDGVYTPVGSGISVHAGDAIVGGAGILNATRGQAAGPFPGIALSASHGIGTPANPVRVADVSDATGPNLLFHNSGMQGDLAISVVTGDVIIGDDVGSGLVGTFNANPNGTYFIRAESGDIVLSTAFRPGLSSAGSLLPGQSVMLDASGNVEIAHSTYAPSALVMDTYGRIVTSGTGKIGIHADGNVITDAGTELTGSTIDIVGTNIVSRGMVNAGAAFTAAADLALDIAGGAIRADAISLAGATVTSTGALTGGPVAASATGNITLSQSPGIILGLLDSSNGTVTVSTGGSIVDGNAVLNISAPAAILNAAGNVGSVGNPIETHVSTLSGSTSSGSFNVINSGDLKLNGISIAGGDGNIGSTGTLSVLQPVSVASGNLSLLANNGMLIGQQVSVGGDLMLDSGGGDLGIAGTAVAANNIDLKGNNIFVGFTSSTAPTSVIALNNLKVESAGNLNVLGGAIGAETTVVASNIDLKGNNVSIGLASSNAPTSVIASNNLKAESAGNLNVLGGANPSASAALQGTEVELTVGTAAGVLNIAAGDNGASAQIRAGSPTSISLEFPNLASGGYFVNGVENLVYDEATNSGFLAGGRPAVLGQNLVVAYGKAPPVDDALDDPIDDAVDDAINLVISGVNQQSRLTGDDDDRHDDDKKKVAGNAGDSKGTKGDKGAKDLPVCN